MPVQLNEPNHLLYSNLRYIKAQSVNMYLVWPIPGAGPCWFFMALAPYVLDQYIFRSGL